MRRKEDVSPEQRLEVNPITCEAVGLCAHLAPDLVSLDRWGYPVMPEGALPAELLATARRAVRGCPRRALGLRGGPAH